MSCIRSIFPCCFTKTHGQPLQEEDQQRRVQMTSSSALHKPPEGKAGGTTSHTTQKEPSVSVTPPAVFSRGEDDDNVEDWVEVGLEAGGGQVLDASQKV